jgi:hypothetical protein
MGRQLVEMDGGLASGVTCGSIWAVRPLGNSPQDSDARIKVKEAFAFVSRAEVIHQGPIEVTFGCFEISHAYGDAVLNILVDSQRDPNFKKSSHRVAILTCPAVSMSSKTLQIQT